MTRSATLTFGDKKIDLPVIEGSEGEMAIDISKLRAATGFAPRMEIDLGEVIAAQTGKA